MSGRTRSTRSPVACRSSTRSTPERKGALHRASLARRPGRGSSTSGMRVEGRELVLTRLAAHAPRDDRHAGVRRPRARQPAAEDGDPLTRLGAGRVSVRRQRPRSRRRSPRTTSTMSRFALKTRSWRSARVAAAEERARCPRARARSRARARAARARAACAGRASRRGIADPATGREIHDRRLEPVAGGEPLVLARQDPVEGRDLLACLVALAEQLDERLAVGGDRDGVLEPRHGVADAHLDRAPLRVRADVPPDVRVVGDAARALELADDRRVVGVVAEARRRARARERREDDLAARREARSAPRARTASSPTSRAAARAAGAAR